MTRFAGLSIGWKLALAFYLVIVLGMGGYWNADRAMRACLRHNRTMEAIVNASMSHTQEAALNAHDTAANTVQFVYSGNASDREHKWETNEAARQAFSDLRLSLSGLPDNTTLSSLAGDAERQEEGICNPVEDGAITLAGNGKRQAAISVLTGTYIGERDKLELTLANLATQLGQYRKTSEAAEMREARHAISVGWLVQGLILLVSVAIAAAVSRHTSSTLHQLQRTRKRLLESERHLISAQRIAGIGNWHLDMVTDHATWSEELYRMLGYVPGEVEAAHKNYLSRIHWDDSLRVEETIRSAQETRQPFDFYHRIIRQDGTQRWVHSRGEFHCDESGNPLTVTGTLQDVTERKQSEDALRDSEARFQRMVANMPGMVYRFVLYADGSVAFPYVSAGCWEMFGLRPEDFIGDAQHIIDLTDPRDLESFQTSVAESARTLSPWHWQGRTHTRAGELKWVQGISQPERMPNGDTIWDGILIDITARKRDEAALARSEERFRSLIRNASDAILILDTDSRLRYVSPGTALCGGLTAPPQEGQLFLDLVHPDDLVRARAMLAQAQANPGVNTIAEMRVIQGDGSRHLEITANDLSDEPSICGLVATCRDITERRAFEEELTHQAFHDGLTGLPNRVLLLDRLERALARPRRECRHVAVLFLDLDNFKVINDSLGHQAGDEFLISVTERLKTCLRPSDTIARIGGDEFVLLLDDVGQASEVVQVAERVLEALRVPILLPGREVFTQVSIGIALGESAGQQADGLLRDADTAMYQAKNNGKARYEIFTHQMNAQAVERLELEGDLRRAIEHGELCLHYQPIFCLQTGRIEEVEALVRWDHPEHGLISPGRFIPIAEETGLIVPLGRWVLYEACRQARQWQTQYPLSPPLVISVNLSGRQLQEIDCMGEVAQALTATGLLPGTLKLEITETVMMRDAEATVDKLHQLRGLGVRLAVDDFGTGYSSMAYLSRFPIDTLKIDRAFVQKMDEPEGYAIVHAILTLANTLGLSVTSEGIETREQWEQLYGLGCERGQGYYFARPLTSEAMAARLASGQDQYDVPSFCIPLQKLAA